MRLLLTGATGFVGQAIHAQIAGGNHEVVISARRPLKNLSFSYANFYSALLEENTDWLPALEGVDAIIHTAARVHVIKEVVSDPLTEFRKINVEGTLALARQAASAGVKRFVFLSSIGVNGRKTLPGCPYAADDIPAPVEPYAVSKLEAERGLLSLAEETTMEVVIIRPVLVYGPGVKGNLHKMMAWLSKELPLPLGAITNKRSFVSIDNLVDLILICVEHPVAANQIFLVSDGDDISTTELLTYTAQALGISPRLLSVPPALLKLGARMIGKHKLADQLCDSLQVDITKTKDILGWTPLNNRKVAIQRMADAYLSAKAS